MTTEFISAKQDIVTTPLPLEKEKPSRKSKYRIWIGNVDEQLNEFSLLQLLKKYGKIQEFDFLFHKSGPLQGKSRGYHFATFCSHEDAVNAIHNLNGKVVLTKTLSVHWADDPAENDKDVHVKINLKTDLTKAKDEISGFRKSKAFKTDMIASLENKLKQMESPVDNSPTFSQGLHPLLKKSKANEAAEEARKKMHPYKSYRRKR